jgi:hypothetical protein
VWLAVPSWDCPLGWKKAITYSGYFAALRDTPGCNDNSPLISHRVVDTAVHGEFDHVVLCLLPYEATSRPLADFAKMYKRMRDEFDRDPANALIINVTQAENGVHAALAGVRLIALAFFSRTSHSPCSDTIGRRGKGRYAASVIKGRHALPTLSPFRRHLALARIGLPLRLPVCHAPGALDVKPDNDKCSPRVSQGC